MIFSEIRASAYKIAAAVLGVLAVALLITCLIFWNSATRANVRADAESARAEALQTELAAVRDVLAIERASAKRANQIAARYEQDKRDAEDAQKRTVDDLRAGNIKLRAQWQGCKAGMPQADGSPGEPDAEADDRAESAGRIIRAADESDAQIKALQEFILSEREAGVIK